MNSAEAAPAGVAVARDSVSIDPPKELFKANYVPGVVRAGYDVAPDGRRYLFVKNSQAPADSTRFNIVINWLEEVDARLARP